MSFSYLYVCSSIDKGILKTLNLLELFLLQKKSTWNAILSLHCSTINQLSNKKKLRLCSLHGKSTRRSSSWCYVLCFRIVLSHSALRNVRARFPKFVIQHTFPFRNGSGTSITEGVILFKGESREEGKRANA